MAKILHHAVLIKRKQFTDRDSVLVGIGKTTFLKADTKQLSCR